MSFELKQVVKQVGTDTHIYETTLRLEPGSLNVLLGPTQAGKTTLMRLMAGLDRPSTGRLLLDGKDVTGVSVRKRSVAMVYQQFINYPSFTVYDNVASPLRRAGVDRDEVDRQVRRAAEALKIVPLLDRLPSELSGGQQQRTALARALVKQAELLLLDEPLVNLDYKLREELRVELQSIFQEGRSIVVYATTEPLEALMLGGNTMVMDKGRVLQSGSTLQVYHQPATERVGQVFSDPPMNVIDGTVDQQTARLGERLKLPLAGHLLQLADGRYRFGVRSNHLFMTRNSADDAEIPATVELAEISGSETFIHAAHGGASWVVQEEGVHGFALGEAIRVYLNPRHLFVFDPDGGLVAAPDGLTPSLAAQ